MAGVLAKLGSERGLVVYGHDGLDELTTTTTSSVVELDSSGEVIRYDVDPAACGLRLSSPSELRGGDAAANASAARAVLAGEPGAHRDVVVLNAAAGLMAGGTASDLHEGMGLAAAAIDDGRAAATLDKLVAISTS
jgi:anthranilate phosphoribosyltransferase